MTQFAHRQQVASRYKQRMFQKPAQARDQDGADSRRNNLLSDEPLSSTLPRSVARLVLYRAVT